MTDASRIGVRHAHSSDYAADTCEACFPGTARPKGHTSMTDTPQAAIDAAAAELHHAGCEDPCHGECEIDARAALAAATPHFAAAERERICAWLDATADATTEDTVRQAGGSEALLAVMAPFIAVSLRSTLHGAAELLRNPERTGQP